MCDLCVPLFYYYYYVFFVVFFVLSSVLSLLQTVGLVHPKLNILSSFIVMLNIKEDILKNAGNQRVYGPN